MMKDKIQKLIQELKDKNACEIKNEVVFMECVKKVFYPMDGAVVQCLPNGDELITFPSIIKACTSTGISVKGIEMCLSGELDQVCGYKWKFKNK